MSRPSFSDPWEIHKDDLTVWRRFWALWELRRKWRWSNSFFQKLDRYDGVIVEPAAWTLSGGEDYMRLCLWIALLRSVHEGITVSLDSYDTPLADRVNVSDVLPPVPSSIQTFPAVRGVRDFRNVVFHCQWVPRHEKLNLNEATTQQLEQLHIAIGDWLEREFRLAHDSFKTKYATPEHWIYLPDGTEFMPELF